VHHSVVVIHDGNLKMFFGFSIVTEFGERGSEVAVYVGI